jgi:hypothetical protein
MKLNGGAPLISELRQFGFQILLAGNASTL